LLRYSEGHVRQWDKVGISSLQCPEIKISCQEKKPFKTLFLPKIILFFLPIFYAKRTSDSSAGRIADDSTVFHNAIHSCCEQPNLKLTISIFRSG